MKIAWFSPLARRSAIGRYSQLVTSELGRLHEVTACSFGSEELLDMDVPVRMFESHVDALAELSKFDVAVYQIGNYWPFHGEIMQTAFEWPGVVVLHDHTIQHLMAAYCFEHLRDGEAYTRLMRELHGDEAAAAAASANRGLRRPVWETDEATLYPLSGAVTKNALGVIAHSEYAIGSVRKSFSGPTGVLPLPYALPKARGVRETLDLAADALLILTVGHINPNKHVNSVIKAIGGLPDSLKQRVVYALLGPMDPAYADEVKKTVADTGLKGQVRFEGFVEDTRLHAFIMRADLCVNLRFPNFEGASASVIEQMLAGKAVVASNTGSFAELPGDTVCAVANEEELLGALTRLLADGTERTGLAERAKAFASQTFRADRYASEFSGFANKVLHEQPLRGLQESLEVHMGNLGVRANDPWAQSIVLRSRQMFGY